MFSIGGNNRSTSERALVPVTEPLHDGAEVDAEEGLFSQSGYGGFFTNDRRKKLMLGIGGVGSLLLLGLVIGIVCISTRTTTPVVPPTPLPITTTSTPTTTTSPTTTTTTTTPPTTTSTTTPPTTTTTPTTTTSTTTTTPKTTTTPTTTTTTSKTTSTPAPKPPSPVPTVHPVPKNPDTIAPETLLYQVGLKLNWTDNHCPPQPPLQASKMTLVVYQDDHPEFLHTYVGESTTKKHAKTDASMKATEDLFGVKYNYTMPSPPYSCDTASALSDIAKHVMDLTSIENDAF